MMLPSGQTELLGTQGTVRGSLILLPLSDNIGLVLNDQRYYFSKILVGFILPSKMTIGVLTRKAVDPSPPESARRP